MVQYPVTVMLPVVLTWAHWTMAWRRFCCRYFSNWALAPSLESSFRKSANEEVKTGLLHAHVHEHVHVHCVSIHTQYYVVVVILSHSQKAWEQSYSYTGTMYDSVSTTCTSTM